MSNLKVPIEVATSVGFVFVGIGDLNEAAGHSTNLPDLETDLSWQLWEDGKGLLAGHGVS